MPQFTDTDEMDDARREYEEGIDDAELNGLTLNKDKWLREVAAAYEVDPEKLREWRLAD